MKYVYKVDHATFMNGYEWHYSDARYLASSYEKALEYIRYHENVPNKIIEKLNDKLWRIEYDPEFRYFIEAIEIDIPMDELYKDL